MRTTINLPDALAEAAKRRAAEERRTFTSLVEEGLRRVLDARDAPVEDVRLTVADVGEGARMLVDPADRRALDEIMDEDLAR